MLIPDFFAAPPAVYAVGNQYQIFVSVTQETLMWVHVNGEDYFDHSNGIMRSGSPTHRMSVPMEELDKAGEYTICYRYVGKRLAYFSEVSDVYKISFSFRPLRDASHIRAYMVADTHHRVNAPVEGALFFGNQLDLLILNGDIPDSSSDIKHFAAFHKIAGKVTEGHIPVVLARGNHDLRGIHAEDLEYHTPGRNGKPYYTFRLGPVWGIVMDCAEDKNDSSKEYGGMICCHAFRKEETQYLREVIRNAVQEYEAPGIQYRLVISHVPFSYINQPPFDIEQDLYKEWCSLIRENIKPDVMLCGHEHKQHISLVGSEHDHQGQPCPVVIGTNPGPTYMEQFGTALDFTPEGIRVRFTDQAHQVLLDETLSLRKKRS